MRLDIDISLPIGYTIQFLKATFEIVPQSPVSTACRLRNNSGRIHVVVVINKGQTLSNYWRLVNQYDGCVWLQSRATLVCNSKSLDDQHIVVVNYVIR